MDKKFITKENKTAYVKLERIVLDQLDHPAIVRLYFTFQDTFSLCRYSYCNFVVVFYFLNTASASQLFYWCSLCTHLFFVMPFWFFLIWIIIWCWFLLLYREDMALESCEGGELFDQITRVRNFIACIHCGIISDLSKENFFGHFFHVWYKQKEK